MTFPAVICMVKTTMLHDKGMLDISQECQEWNCTKKSVKHFSLPRSENGIRCIYGPIMHRVLQLPVRNGIILILCML